MSWPVFALPLLVLCLVVAALLRRRHELRTYERSLADRQAAKERGSHQARLQHPRIDLGQCIGCAACIRACPEDGVLALAYGQAVVVHGARCVGHGLCAAACPTGAIALTLGDLRDRRDLPAVDEHLEAVGVPGLFLAGELTGFALVRTAVQHGAMVGRTVAARRRATPPAGRDGLDLVVVGLGPAGIACLLAAREHGLAALGIDQAPEIGGTVAAYPRRKLVMTQPMELPLHGRLGRLEYGKEELVELWRELVATHDLPVRLGTAMQRVERRTDGQFVVHTAAGPIHARHVCLALGRRGSPTRLGVPGEHLPKVAYALLDAEGVQDRRCLVIGGGDSAIEAALALAEQAGNTVTLSYRKPAFSRLKQRNEERIAAAQAAGRVQVWFGSQVVAIEPESVRLAVPSAGAGVAGGPGGAAVAVETVLPNDEVYVFAGGQPPFPLLEQAGVSMDPALRPAERVATDRGTGLLVALAATAAALGGLWWFRQVHAAYYDLSWAQRAGHAAHDWLRPQGGLGLAAGLGAVALFAVNLLYLLRRHGHFGRWLPGSLRAWMSLHVATGLGAFLLAFWHSGFGWRRGAGGHALLAMAVVVAAGVVGRWLYAFVPRAQNGRQQQLDELRSQSVALAGEWDRHGRGFGAEVRRRIDGLASAAQLGQGFLARVVGLIRSQWRLRRELGQLRQTAADEGIPAAEIGRLLGLATRSHRLQLQLVHFEEVRGVLSTWRWLHRWLALLLLLLLVVHVVIAFRYGGVEFPQWFGGGR